MEDIKEELIRQNIRIENAYFIMGYFSDKPDKWKMVFLYKMKGETQKDIAVLLNTEQQRISEIMVKIKNTLKPCISET